MKKLSLMATAILFNISVFAQSINGTLTVENSHKLEIKAPSNKVVDLYAMCRENKYPIHFKFEGKDIIKNEEGKEVVQFVFNTTVKKEGKVLKAAKRNPIPFFPGNMFMPVETFDFISILSNIQNNTADKNSEIPEGNYEILLEAKAINTKGAIQPMIIFFNVKKEL